MRRLDTIGSRTLEGLALIEGRRGRGLGEEPPGFHGALTDGHHHQGRQRSQQRGHLHEPGILADVGIKQAAQIICLCRGAPRENLWV